MVEGSFSFVGKLHKIKRVASAGNFLDGFQLLHLLPQLKSDQMTNLFFLLLFEAVFAIEEIIQLHQLRFVFYLTTVIASPTLFHFIHLLHLPSLYRLKICSNDGRGRWVSRDRLYLPLPLSSNSSSRTHRTRRRGCFRTCL